MTRILVAGVGNIFLRDDGFGPEAVHRLMCQDGGSWQPPDGVHVVDYGIRGMHLAYDLVDGYDVLLLVDAIPGDSDPGTIAVLEVDANDLSAGQIDAHGMDPVAVLGSVRSLGGELPRAYVVGCQPADVTDGIGLSDEVTGALDEAVTTIKRLVADLASDVMATATRQG
ncbi:MAG: hydrogenase maturation protease [Nocardioidaceae bacterium]